MDIPVLITVEQETLDYIYSIVFHPAFLVGAVVFVFCIVYVSIMFLERRSGTRKLELESGIERHRKVPPRPPPPPQEELSASGKLKKREGELREQEEAFKKRKRNELEKRATDLENREGGGGESDDIEQPIVPTSPGKPKGLEDERARIKRMIELAEERFHNGEIDKEKFRSLTRGYYNKLLDVDTQIRDSI